MCTVLFDVGVGIIFFFGVGGRCVEGYMCPPGWNVGEV